MPMSTITITTITMRQTRSAEENKRDDKQF